MWLRSRGHRNRACRSKLRSRAAYEMKGPDAWVSYGSSFVSRAAQPPGVRKVHRMKRVLSRVRPIVLAEPGRFSVRSIFGPSHVQGAREGAVVALGDRVVEAQQHEDRSARDLARAPGVFAVPLKHLEERFERGGVVRVMDRERCADEARLGGRLGKLRGSRPRGHESRQRPEGLRPVAELWIVLCNPQG